MGAQVFDDYGTMRARGPLGNTKWAWSPYWRWSHHSDETWDTLMQQLDPMEVPSSRHQRMDSEVGYGRLNVHPTLRSASICICDLLPLII